MKQDYFRVFFFPFAFSLLISIPLLLHTLLSGTFDVCDSPDQTARYHILYLLIWGYYSDPAVLSWLQSEDVSYWLGLERRQHTEL
jgi:hypothetical protein